MGLIMLILIGVAPTAYALNRTMPDSSTPAFIQTAEQARMVFRGKAGDTHPRLADAERTLREALGSERLDTPNVYAALDTVADDIDREIRRYGAISHVPAAATKNLRNDMYVVYDTLRLLTKDEATTARFGDGLGAVKAYQAGLERSTRYIPTWVKIAVALALGLGTMVGWKRIVRTVGEGIGKTHLTYGMGAAAEMMAASTILLAQVKGLPVSTTHILSSGVAGTMVADGAGVQRRTVRAIVLAWVATLPAAIILAGLLYWALLTLVRAFGL